LEKPINLYIFHLFVCDMRESFFYQQKYSHEEKKVDYHNHDDYKKLDHTSQKLGISKQVI